MASFRGTDLNAAPMGSLNATYNEADFTAVLTFVDRDRADRTAVIKLTMEESVRVLQQLSDIVQAHLIPDPESEGIRDMSIVDELPLDVRVNLDGTTSDAQTDPLPEGGFSGEGSPDSGVIQPFFGTTNTPSNVDTELERAIKDAQV